MCVVMQRVNLTMAGRANANRGTGLEVLAFGFLAWNQVVFSEGRQVAIAKLTQRHIRKNSAIEQMALHKF